MLLYDVEDKRVVTCFLEHDGKIALFRRSNTVETYRGKWAGISGYIEEDSTGLSQALDEIKEETGLRAMDIFLLGRGAPVRFIDKKLKIRWEVHPFVFRIKDSSLIRLNEEHTEMKWINPEEMRKMDTVPKLWEAWLSATNPDWNLKG